MLNAIVKYLAVHYPVPLLVWARYAMQAVAMVLWLGPTMRLRLVHTRQPGLQIARGVVLLLSSLSFFTALRYLPLAEASALGFAAPTLVMLLSAAVLKERMTRARWAFVVAGALGMLLVLRPGAAIVHGGALFAFAGAFFYASFQVLTRKLAAADPRVTLFYPALAGTVVMTLLLPFLDRDVDMPWTHVGLVLATGLLGTVGHFLFIHAFQRAPASGLTPFTYIQLVWATLFGLAFFGQFPDGFALAGMTIIAGSGFLLAWHERRLARVLAASPGTAAVD